MGVSGSFKGGEYTMKMQARGEKRRQKSLKTPERPPV